MTMETNKIFAAVLVAGIIAMLGGFMADLVMPPRSLDEPAYHIDVPDDGTGPAVAAADAGPEPIEHLMAEADIDRGRRVSRACLACHSFDQSREIRPQGPPLWGIVGKPLASVDGFTYSSALKEEGGTWTVEKLNEYLWNPRRAIPGNRMNYRGIRSPEDRAALIAYMKTMQ